MALPATRFTVTDRALTGRVARLGYRLEGDGEALDLVETFTLPDEVPDEGTF